MKTTALLHIILFFLFLEDASLWRKLFTFDSTPILAEEDQSQLEKSIHFGETQKQERTIETPMQNSQLPEG